MKLPRLLLAAALCAGLTAPLVAVAQTAPTQPTSGTVTGNGSTPVAGERRQAGLNRRAMRGITLTDDQKQQIQTLVAQYQQDHPAGSPRDPQSAKTLRASLLNVLTTDQQTQYLSNLATIRKNRKDAKTSAEAPTPTPTP